MNIGEKGLSVDPGVDFWQIVDNLRTDARVEIGLGSCVSRAVCKSRRPRVINFSLRG